jgi:hypothetical protein
MWSFVIGLDFRRRQNHILRDLGPPPSLIVASMPVQFKVE